MSWQFFVLVSVFSIEIFLPIRTDDRKTIERVELTEIGKFAIPRRARPTVPAHLHTGIDIKRPHQNYVNEPIFAVAEGTVISKRDDGAYAQLIIEHQVGKLRFWTVYEHIAGLNVSVHDRVTPARPIARFMNKEELNKYGWQFDHFHFEILKVAPIPLKFDPAKPQRLFNSYSLVCYSKSDLDKYFYDPLTFLRKQFNH
ncbi:MAG TPA: M23 family metallopeptidase [Cyclobacteriaceae bacterium]|nr:M23 family metallopeptidase [Cyclobacteriaceae bacterium]HMV08923.1 M23 family metallopeptidase [Cyclobacteriaceae bacterium]HMV90447.1 M23 family metallopeptidase [Cyclobacteriaceae bacterium]HMX00322.1 M23 family metallopeptidase [Cyclobacteriaceae bacterium]HMX49679.1 M23 family metallopeptidase [Cyclobacteriaceae bacterium]